MNNRQKHPRGLMVLFYTEMWERFSYYGMRALLVLYLTAEVAGGGFGLDRTTALKIYATFTGLVYLTPIIGGYLSDKFLGQQKAVYIGAFLMAIGQFFMAASEFGETLLREGQRNFGLGLIIVGTGFFKANISTIVGSLYQDNDARKDSAFTIFYMGINIGALLGPFIAGFLAQEIDWFWGFFSAGTGMILSTIWFYSQRHKLGTAGLPPQSLQKGIVNLTRRDGLDILLYVVSIVALIWSFLKLWSFVGTEMQSIILWILLGAGSIILAWVIIGNTRGRQNWSNMGVFFILAFFNILFWSGYEQAGGTFNLFAQNHVDRHTLFGEFPASWFLSVPALYIVLFASLFAILWVKLNAIGKEPRTPVKFALGLMLMSLGFVIMNLAAGRAGQGIMVSPFWLLAVYFMHTMGELCLSPIGLSMVTKLAPKSIVSVMMGLWFASIALANYLAGVMESILHNLLPEMGLYTFLTFTTLGSGVILLLISPLLNKLMKDIH